MKNAIEGLEFIPQTKVMAWLAEAKQIVADLKLEDSTVYHPEYIRKNGKLYVRNYQKISEVLDKIANYPHTAFAKRYELMELLQAVTKRIDSAVAFEASKTVKVIRLSDGAEIMTTEEMADYVVKEGLAKYA